MKPFRDPRVPLLRQAGLTLVEMIVSIAISLTIMSGVVQVLVVSKSNFVTERELATLQENARFALKYMADEIRLAGYTGCGTSPPNVARSINWGTPNWYLNTPGMQGYEYDAGTLTFPTEFRTDVRANTDAIVVRRGKPTNLQVTLHTVGTSANTGGTNNTNSGLLTVSAAHSFQRGQPFIITHPNCAEIGIFQMTGPVNTTNTATTIQHRRTTTTAVPGNCTNAIRGTFTCASASSITGSVSGAGYVVAGTLRDAALLELSSQAFYVGSSATDSTVPALFRERMLVNSSTMATYTTAEEVVQGIENMQILYGYDADANGLADRYMKANSVTTWANVVAVRLTMRMRSVYPVYNKAMAYGTFEGISGTGGSDAYMRQTLSTTIMLRTN